VPCCNLHSDLSRGTTPTPRRASSTRRGDAMGMQVSRPSAEREQVRIGSPLASPRVARGTLGPTGRSPAPRRRCAPQPGRASAASVLMTRGDGRLGAQGVGGAFSTLCSGGPASSGRAARRHGRGLLRRQRPRHIRRTFCHQRQPTANPKTYVWSFIRLRNPKVQSIAP